MMKGRCSGLWPCRAGWAAFALYVAAETAGHAANSDLDFVLSIEVGRLETMVSKAEDVIETVAGQAALPEAAEADDVNEGTLQTLREVVRRYNRLTDAACRVESLQADLCTRQYKPDWLDHRPGERYDESRLQAMIGAASAAIRPFWDKACKRGTSVLADEHFCELE